MLYAAWLKFHLLCVPHFAYYCLPNLPQVATVAVLRKPPSYSGCLLFAVCFCCCCVQTASSELTRLQGARAAVSARIADLEGQLGLIVQEEELLQQRREGERESAVWAMVFACRWWTAVLLCGHRVVMLQLLLSVLGEVSRFRTVQCVCMAAVLY
jgi:hypothetical protein